MASELKVFPSIGPDFQISTTLEDIKINLRFIWNTEVDEWVLNTYEETENDIAFYGIKVKPFWNLLKNLITADQECSILGGLLVVTDQDNIDVDITYDNFGTVWRLVYFTESELEEWNTELGL